MKQTWQERIAPLKGVGLPKRTPLKTPLERAVTNKKAYLERTYGITLETYNEMLVAQKGLCCICERSIWDDACVDHDHETEVVRGLLCVTCNIGLGSFQDNPTFLAEAIKYLTR